MIQDVIFALALLLAGLGVLVMLVMLVYNIFRRSAALPIPWAGWSGVTAGLFVVMFTAVIWGAAAGQVIDESNGTQTTATLTEDAVEHCVGTVNLTCTWRAAYVYSVGDDTYRGFDEAPALAVIDDVIPIIYLTEDASVSQSMVDSLTGLGGAVAVPGGDWGVAVIPIFGFGFALLLFGWGISIGIEKVKGE